MSEAWFNWQGTVPVERICYYTTDKDEMGADRVRFGLSRRPQAQIIVTCERWQCISKRLADGGYRVVEVQQEEGDTNGCGS